MKQEIRNGVNVTDLKTAIEAVSTDPTNGRLTFSVSSTWTGGFTCKHTPGTYTVGTDTGKHKKAHTIKSDEPREVLGTDTGISPAEMILGALAACLTVGYAANAAVQNIDIDALKFEITTNGNLEGFFGVGDTRPGLSDIHVKTHIKSAATTEQLQRLHDDVNRRSPIWDTLRNSVNITSTMVTGMKGTA